jgi:hypothetical protein
MIGAFAYLTAISFRNRIVTRFRRLRNPRYLISAIAGLAYIWFFAFRHVGRSPRPNIGSSPLGVDMASVVVLSMMVIVWALPGQSGGLEFSEAEIQFLFPAPVSRRQLLIYKLIRGLPQLVMTTLVMTYFLRRTNFPGLLLAVATMNVYFTMVALGRARLKLLGIGFISRLVGVVVIVGAISWAMTVSLADQNIGRKMARELKAQHPQTAMAIADTPFHGRTVDAMLFVPRIFTHTAFARTPVPFAVNGAALVTLAALFFFIAARLNVSFEEASIAASAKRATRQAGRQSQQPGTRVMFRRMPPPFRLRETAGPEMAIFWKNLVAAMRISAAWMIGIIVLAAYFALQITFSRNPGVRLAFASMQLGMAGLFPLIGTVWFAQDLRLDLPRMEVLKSYPISGERLVAAEIAAPLVIISIIELILVGAASVLLQGFETTGPLKFFASPEFVIVALLFAVPICGTQLVIRNAVPVFLPAWAYRSKDEPRGFVMTGQRLVLMIGNLIVLAVALIPAAVLFLPALWIATRFFAGSPLVLAVATVPSVALLVGEVWLGIRLLGAQFDRIDVTNDLDPMAV